MTVSGVRARLLVIATAVLACARSLPPPGGPPDRMPPQIIGTTPEPLSVVDTFEGPVVFLFDERISERGVDRSVLVSPETGEVHVSKGRSELRVDLEGGWRDGVVYRVLLAPGVRDLFGNERRIPADLVFSTGPPIVNTAFGGLVSDRISGRLAQQAMVEATHRTDSLVYITAADSMSFFSFRNLPLGIYDVVAWADGNRNQRRDDSESASLNVVVTLNSERDTVDLDLAVVPPDTTPPKLLRAEGRDSLQIRLFTDDYLDPDVPLSSLQIRLLSLPDSEAVGGALTLMQTDTFAALERARADSAAADSSAAALDTVARPDTAVADTAVVAALPPTGRGLPVAARGGLPVRPGAAAAIPGLPPIGPLPYREFVIVPSDPLAPGDYLVELTGLINISRRSGGGGTLEFQIVPRPPPDTVGVRPDTSRVRPDTGTVMRVTGGALRDRRTLGPGEPLATRLRRREMRHR